MIILLFKEIYRLDYSVKPSNICNIKNNVNVWLVSYADGDDVYFANQRTLVSSSCNNCIDFVKSYKFKHLDKDFVQRNSNILLQSRGRGYWLWKPYVILHTLKNIPDGEIVLYVDGGLKIINPVDSLINKLLEKDFLVFPMHQHLNRYWIKRDLLVELDMDEPKYRDTPQLNSAVIIIRNSVSSRKIISKWLELAQHEKLLTDVPSKEEHSDFIEHRHDQAIFSLLYLQEKNKFSELSSMELDKYFFHHRRRRIKNSLLLLDGGKLGRAISRLSYTIVKYLN